MAVDIPISACSFRRSAVHPHRSNTQGREWLCPSDPHAGIRMRRDHRFSLTVDMHRVSTGRGDRFRARTCIAFRPCTPLHRWKPQRFEWLVTPDIHIGAPRQIDRESVFQSAPAGGKPCPKRPVTRSDADPHRRKPQCRESFRWPDIHTEARAARLTGHVPPAAASAGQPRPDWLPASRTLMLTIDSHSMSSRSGEHGHATKIARWKPRARAHR